MSKVCAKFGRVRSASGKMVTRCKAWKGTSRRGRLGELRGDVMRCVRYGKTAKTNKWRCAEYASGPGVPKRRPDVTKTWDHINPKTGELTKKTRHIPYSYSSAKARVRRGSGLRSGKITTHSVNTTMDGQYRKGHSLGRRAKTTTR